MVTKRKVIVYIAMSLDGYIAASDNDLSFLSIVEQQGQDYGYDEFNSSTDTVITGRKTYDWVLSQMGEFHHSDKEVYVITRNPELKSDKIQFYSGDLIELVLNLKLRKGRNIFVEGGAEIINELLNKNLIDEFYISIIPVLLGNGIRLFQDGRPEQVLELISSRHFEKGLTQIHYKNLK